MLVRDYLPKADVQEIVLVPRTQVGPICLQCCKGCDKCFTSNFENDDEINDELKNSGSLEEV